MILFSSATSEQQRPLGVRRVRALKKHPAQDPRNSSKSHAVALITYTHTDRKAKKGSTGTGRTKLSYDLLICHRGVLGAFMAAVPELGLGTVVR